MWVHSVISRWVRTLESIYTVVTSAPERMNTFSWAIPIFWFSSKGSSENGILAIRIWFELISKLSMLVPYQMTSLKKWTQVYPYSSVYAARQIEICTSWIRLLLALNGDTLQLCAVRLCNITIVPPREVSAWVSNSAHAYFSGVLQCWRWTSLNLHLFNCWKLLLIPVVYGYILTIISCRGCSLNIWHMADVKRRRSQ